MLYNVGVNISHVDKHGWDSVAMGAVRGFDQFCKYLIAQGAYHDSVDVEGRTPLMKAAAHGHYATFRLLVEKGADLNRTDNSGLTAMHHATIFALQSDLQNAFLKNVIDLLKHLFTARGDVTVTTNTDYIDRYNDKDGRTCLMYSAISDNLEMVAMLLEAGADPRRMDNYGVRASSMSSDPTIRHMMAEYSVILVEREHKQWLQTKRKKNNGNNRSKA